jgi:hypothetical protein
MDHSLVSKAGAKESTKPRHRIQNEQRKPKQEKPKQKSENLKINAKIKLNAASETLEICT